MAGSLIAYCACRSPETGKPYPAGACPKGSQRGHRKWMFIIDQDRLYDPETKRWKRQQLKRSGFPTRQAAERALEAEVPRIRDHSAPTLSDRQLSVAEFLERWLVSDPTWRPSTRSTYKAAVSGYLLPTLGVYRLADLRPEHITAMLARMRAQGLSRRTVHQVYGILRTALNQAIRERRITWNPCSAVRTESPDRPPVQAWTPEQVSAFLAHAAEREPSLAPAFQLAAWRGLRRGEIAALQWRDIDLDAGTCAIVRNVTEVDRQLHTGQPKTERGKRVVSLGPKLVAVLRAHRRVQPVLGLDGWVFTDERGHQLAPHRLSHRFKSLARELPELPEMWLHGLRHTAATMMLAAGVAPKVVQDQLGHATLAMTMDVYASVIPQQRDASADAVEALFR